MEDLLRISQVAEKTGVTPRTIRFYVQEGLIREPIPARRNMALYHPECIGQIQAIRRAQSERFLPLVVIRSILEKNSFDYAALDTAGVPVKAETPKDMGEHGDNVLAGMPELMRRVLETREWIHKPSTKTSGYRYGQAGEPLIRLMGILNRQGAPWQDLVSTLAAIEDRVRETVELELQFFTGWALNNPVSDFPDIQGLAKEALSQFISQSREHHLTHAVHRYKMDLDYSFLSSADEGFALPPECLRPELDAMEARLVPRKPSPRALNDLALGYSCIGEIDTALKYLRRVKRSHPDDLETQVRWIWYRRFSSREKGAPRMKAQMQALADKHPDYAIGRAFLGIWHMFDSHEADDLETSFRLANLCLNEFAAAEDNMPVDPHQQTLIRYAKSRVLMFIPEGADHIVQSINSFSSLLDQKAQLDEYYALHLPFFPKWLWPNLYYFSGMANLRAGRYETALNMFEKGSRYKMLPPYSHHIHAGIKTAASAIQGGRHDRKTVLEPGDGDPLPKGIEGG